MEDFIMIEDKTHVDYLMCIHCKKRVERGILNISRHWMNCLKRTDGLIITDDPCLRKVLDSMSINV